MTYNETVETMDSSVLIETGFFFCFFYFAPLDIIIQFSMAATDPHVDMNEAHLNELMNLGVV